MEVAREKRNADITPDLQPVRLSQPLEGGHSKRGQICRLASSKYRVLPEICSSTNQNAIPPDEMSKFEYVNQKSCPCSVITRGPNQIDSVKYSSVDKSHKLDAPHLQTSTYSLAIKLPDGKRILSNFKGSDRLKSVMKAIEMKTCKSLKGCQLWCHTNQKIYSDLTQRLSDSDIEDKSTLYVQIPDK